MVDEIDAEKGSKIEVRFHPGVDFDIQENLTLPDGKNGKMAVIPVLKEVLKVQAGKHAIQYINATNRFSWIDYFDSEIISKENKTIFAMLILPVENSGEAKQIASTKELTKDGTGNVTVSFSMKGEKYSFHFENREGGLVWKN